jgi:hypothetical protein
MDIDVISPDGQRFVLDHGELDKARAMGFKSLSEIMTSSHRPSWMGPETSQVIRPSHDAPPEPPRPSALSQIGSTMNNFGSSLAHGISSSWMGRNAPGVRPEELEENNKYYEQAKRDQPAVAGVGNFLGEANTPESMMAGAAGGGAIKALGQAYRGRLAGKAFAKAAESAPSWEEALSAGKQMLSPGQAVKDVVPAVGAAAGYHFGGYPGAYIGNVLMGGAPKAGGAISHMAAPLTSIGKAISSPALRYQMSRMALNRPVGYTLGALAGEEVPR